MYRTPAVRFGGACGNLQGVTPPLTRRLGLILAVAVAGFVAVFVLPSFAPSGSKDAYPAWRSIDGVPVIDELPDDLVGVVRIARERNTEQARASIVLAPGPAAPCEPARVSIGGSKPYVQTPDPAEVASDCKGLRLISLKALPGPIVITIDGDEWSLDPSIRDPRSCQLGRDRTCAYWLYEGGRFGDPIETAAPRVQSGTPQTSLAVGDALLAGPEDQASRVVTFGDPLTLLLCAAAAAPVCEAGLAAGT